MRGAGDEDGVAHDVLNPNAKGRIKVTMPDMDSQANTHIDDVEIMQRHEVK